MSRKRLNVEKNTGYLFFRNPPLPLISTLSLGQKGCAYYGESAYYECAYYEWAQYLKTKLRFKWMMKFYWWNIFSACDYAFNVVEKRHHVLSQKRFDFYSLTGVTVKLDFKFESCSIFCWRLLVSYEIFIFLTPADVLKFWLIKLRKTATF